MIFNCLRFLILFLTLRPVPGMQTNWRYGPIYAKGGAKGVRAPPPRAKAHAKGGSKASGATQGGKAKGTHCKKGASWEDTNVVPEETSPYWEALEDEQAALWQEHQPLEQEQPPERYRGKIRHCRKDQRWVGRGVHRRQRLDRVEIACDQPPGPTVRRDLQRRWTSSIPPGTSTAAVHTAPRFLAATPAPANSPVSATIFVTAPSCSRAVGIVFVRLARDEKVAGTSAAKKFYESDEYEKLKGYRADYQEFKGNLKDQLENS